MSDNSSDDRLSPLSWLRNLRVAGKLVVSISVVCALTVVVGVVGMLQLEETNDRTEQMYQDNLLAISYVGDVRADLAFVRFQLTNMLIADSAADKAQAQQQIDQLDAEFPPVWRSFSNMID